MLHNQICAAVLDSSAPIHSSRKWVNLEAFEKKSTHLQKGDGAHDGRSKQLHLSLQWAIDHYGSESPLDSVISLGGYMGEDVPP